MTGGSIGGTARIGRLDLRAWATFKEKIQPASSCGGTSVLITALLVRDESGLALKSQKHSAKSANSWELPLTNENPERARGSTNRTTGGQRRDGLRQFLRRHAGCACNRTPDLRCRTARRQQLLELRRGDLPAHRAHKSPRIFSCRSLLSRCCGLWLATKVRCSRRTWLGYSSCFVLRRTIRSRS
jgi:hypothetical protein